jgi:hypothetical protein
MGYIDQFVTREHIRRTLSDPAVNKLHFRLGPIVINPADYRTILTAIMNNHIPVHYSPMESRHDAEYSASRDVLEFPIPDRGGFMAEYRRRFDLERLDHPRALDRNHEVATELVNRMMLDQSARYAGASLDPYAEMVIIHECTHAIVDWFNFSRRHIEIHRWETEAVSFISENIYILEKTQGRADIGSMNDAIVALSSFIQMSGYYEIGSNRLLRNEIEQVRQSLTSRGYQNLDEVRISNGVAPRSPASSSASSGTR